MNEIDLFSFQKATPFPHLILDDFLDHKLALQLEKDFPKEDAKVWHQYDNPLEKKLICSKKELFPKSIRQTIETLNSNAFARRLGSCLGLSSLSPDPELHGGGLHATRRGGKLDVHIDYAIHPKLRLERKLNLIIFLNQNWKAEFGGALEFWDDKMQAKQAGILPQFNRAVLFETSDTSFHGQPEPLLCPPGHLRKSIALYYLSPRTDQTTNRYKARFVARPQDPRSPELDELRRRRAGLETAAEVYRYEPKEKQVEE